MAEPIDLGEALDAVVTSIRAQFAGFKVEAAEDLDRRQLPVPCILVAIAELEPDLDNDPTTGEFPCLVRFEARVVLGHRTAQVRREVLKAAGAVAAFVHKNRFGIRWGGARVLSVEPDEFAPTAQEFDVWLVEWAHRAAIGQSLEIDASVVPTDVFLSQEPSIGADHLDDYVKVTSDE